MILCCCAIPNTKPPAKICWQFLPPSKKRTRLSADLDLNLLWEIVAEQGRGFSADELAELFFGSRTPGTTSVMLEALLQDRLYFVRRHLEFVPRSAEQVDRLRVQQDKIRLRSETSRRTRTILRGVIEEGLTPPPDEAAPLAIELRRYLDNPFTRNRDLTAMIEAALPDIPPRGSRLRNSYDRIGGAPPGSRFALIGGVRNSFSDAAFEEARTSVAPCVIRVTTISQSLSTTTTPLRLMTPFHARRWTTVACASESILRWSPTSWLRTVRWTWKPVTRDHRLSAGSLGSDAP